MFVNQSPSKHRIVAATFALAGCTLSLYLGLFQYGEIDRVWEPFFGDGSDTVLHSGLLDPLSRWLGFPIHDAILGSAAYGAGDGVGIARGHEATRYRILRSHVNDGTDQRGIGDPARHRGSCMVYVLFSVSGDFGGYPPCFSSGFRKSVAFPPGHDKLGEGYVIAREPATNGRTDVI